MKMISRPLFIVGLICCTSLLLSVVSRASDGVQGGNINGTETFDAQVTMTPTASAIAGSSIQLSIEAQDNDGAMQGSLSLDAKGLAAGTFNVSVTLKSTGATVALGSFTVAAGSTETLVQFGDSGTPFPANFNPFDIATVSVSDSSNVVLFTADLTNLSSVTSMNFTASLAATPGTTDPNADGQAVLTAHTAKGSGAHGMLVLIGHGLTHSATLQLAVNGTDVASATVNKGGNLNVQISSAPTASKGKHKKPGSGSSVNFFSVESVTLHDSVGNVLLSVDF